MLAYQGRVTATTVEGAVEKVFAKYPLGRCIKLVVKEAAKDWYEYIITLEGDGDEV